MKILYFSATGNSLYIAKRLGGELLSMPELHRNGVYEITGDTAGIVCPVYGFSLPNLVKDYLEKAVIRAEYIFSIMTFGNVSLAALSHMKKLLEKRGAKPDYLNEIKMVDNYLPLFDSAAQRGIHRDENIESKINEITHDIQEQKHFAPGHTAFQKFISGGTAALWGNKRAMNRRDKDFTVNDACNACGTCRAVCPAGNIAGTKKPLYRHTCEFCLACIHLCPKNAIHLKNEKSWERFRHPRVTTAEIINANRQLR